MGLLRGRKAAIIHGKSNPISFHLLHHIASESNCRCNAQPATWDVLRTSCLAFTFSSACSCHSFLLFPFSGTRACTHEHQPAFSPESLSNFQPVASIEEKEERGRADFRGPTVGDGWLGLFLACAALLWLGGGAKPGSCHWPIRSSKSQPRLHSSSGRSLSD